MVARISKKQLVRPGRSYLLGYICIRCRCDDAGKLDYLMGTDRLRQVHNCAFFCVFFFVVVFVTRQMNNVDVVTFTIIFDQDQSKGVKCAV